jgi:large subunit ribosomal protein L29
MKSQKVRDLDDQELRRQLLEMNDQLFRFQFQMSMGQMDGLKKARAMRKDRARILTVLRERELAGGTKYWRKQTTGP